MNNIDIIKMQKQIPSYQKRKNSKQPPTRYGLFIYARLTEHLTKSTKKRKGITKTTYKKQNQRSYKNLHWLNTMYDRKMKALSHLQPEDYDPLFKVILPLEFPNKYKLYDVNGEYYGTVLDSNDIFLYVAIGKDKPDILYLLRSKIEELYLKAQCEQTYGFIVPEEFVKDYERPG